MATRRRRFLIAGDEDDIREVTQVTLEVTMPDMDGPAPFRKPRACEETGFDPMTLPHPIATLLHWNP